MKIIKGSKLSYAFKYLKRGWSIIPTQHKMPLIKWKSFQSRRPLKKEIQDWFKKWPNVGLSLVLGEISGIIALDIDSPEALAALAEMEKKHGRLPRTPKVRTSRGFHYYFKHPGYFVRYSAINPGLEIKGDNSLITLPPSVHRSGKKYEWLVGPWECEPAPMPSWLLALTKEDSDTSSPINEVIPEGQRNQALAKVASVLRVGLGLPEQAIYESLKSLNPIICEKPLPENELKSMAKSFGNYSSKYHSVTHIPISVTESKWYTAPEFMKKFENDVQWLWTGYIGLGMVSLFSARPKVGKTTLLFHLLKAIFRREYFLGFKTEMKGKILLLSEEPASLLKRRMTALGLVKEDFLIMPRFNIKSWAEAVAYVESAVEKENVQLVVIDTIAAFWNVEAENDATHIMNALRPIQAVIHKHNAALLLIHHLRKADGKEGTAHRGSGALVGAVETAFELGKSSKAETHRVLKAIGRYEETLNELEIELTKEAGYRSLGSPELVEYHNARNRIYEVIPEEKSDAVSDESIRDLIPDPKPSKTNIKKILTELVSDGDINYSGKGVKGNRRLYWRSNPAENKSVKIVRKKSA